MGGLNRGRRLILSLFCFFCQPVWAAGPPVENATQRISGGDATELAFYSPDRVAALFGAESGIEDAWENGGCARAKVLVEESGTGLDLGKVIAYKGSPVCYQYFKQQGMLWPESANKLGVGPLHVAVKYNNRKMVTWLTQQDPDLWNSQDKEGRRPFLYSQDDAMTMFLLNHGATPPEEWVK